MATYRNWLFGQIGRGDVISDLAVAIQGSANKPRASGVDGIERWIRTESRFNLEWALQAHSAAVAAYTAENGHVQTKVIIGDPVEPMEGTPLATVTQLRGSKTEPAVISNRQLLTLVSDQLDALLANQAAIMKHFGIEGPVPDFAELASMAVYEDEPGPEQAEPEPAAGGESGE